LGNLRKMTVFTKHIPLQQIALPGNVKLWVLRLDTIDHYAGGNKYFKLKYNLEEAKKQGHSKILTFGGSWSNHLAAIATADNWREAGGSRVAVVRGEEPEVYSETLKFCQEKGMLLHFVSRADYRRKNEPEFIEELKNKFGDFYLLPEGGSNELAVKGCHDILNYINIDFDYVCCPVGSGGTIAGIAGVLKEHQNAMGFVALKGGEYLSSVVVTLNPKTSNFKLIHDYHFGGFAKTTPELISFKKEFEKQNGFELDYIYTSKMFYGIYDLLKKNFFKPGSTVVAIHTGGLQGNKGFE
jgi:1-aminocyclopropane-1-carboxylate deaminase